MKGGIYPTFWTDGRQRGWQVRFGKITRRFGILGHTDKPHRDLTTAERFLNGLRFETDKGSFDLRDYRKSKPLSFKVLSEKWLSNKRKTPVKDKHVQSLETIIEKAGSLWNDLNIKAIGSGEIEDFIFSLEVSSKTRANYKSALHDFWGWVCRREGIKMPEFPEVSFKLETRAIISLEDQAKIIDEIKRISYHINPKIWLGVRFLATYINTRPGELISIKEGEIFLDRGMILIPAPKERIPKFIFLTGADLSLLKSLPRGLPHLFFFRHPKGNGAASPGQKFGKDYLYKWWKTACDNLGIYGIDLYGGTRHSSTTAMKKFFSPEEIKGGTGHISEAFERYFQRQSNDAVTVYDKIQEVRGDNKGITKNGGFENGNIFEFK